jgi:hypothetical protein
VDCARAKPGSANTANKANVNNLKDFIGLLSGYE